MTAVNRNKSTKKSSGSRIAVVVILSLVIATIAGYFFFPTTRKTVVSPLKPENGHVTPVAPHSTVQKSTIPVSPETSPQLHKKPNDYPPATTIPETGKSRAGEGGSARLAIIIDDMGNSMAEARSLGAIKVPLTFAIIPGLRVDTAVSEYAAEHQIETMIHVPMQSKGWPERRLETNGLLVTMDEGEIQERMSAFLEKFPGAVGVNNHMGSAFTEQEKKMTAVLQPLKKGNLFFIDSVTSPESVGVTVAQRLGLRSARRNVFLDNEQNRGYIVGQLNQAVRLARKNGSAIAICHPHPATIAALAAALPELAAQGVTLVPVSRLVK